MDDLKSDALVNNVVDQLWLPNEEGKIPSVFAILDGARDRRIEPMVNNSQLDSACMYTDVKTYALKRSAPHIVCLESKNEFTRKILREGWGQSWGIFISTFSDIPLSKVRHHFRLISSAQLPGGDTVVFRYYDPRVLRILLPSCDAEQIAQLFSDSFHIMTESDDGENILRFMPNNQRDKVLLKRTALR